jgi:hypothetical protein
MPRWCRQPAGAGSRAAWRAAEGIEPFPTRGVGQKKMKTNVSDRILCVVSILSLIFLAGPSMAQSWTSGESGPVGYEYEGIYAQFGATIGVIEFDNRRDADAGGGFTLTGGYRLLSWLSGEANVTYVGGGNAEGPGGDASFYAFTFGPKFYPLGPVKDSPIPELIQPYGLVGLGGGEFKVDDTNYDKTSFIARFLLGVDFWLSDHFGGFIEGGYHVAAESDVDGAGVFSFGGQIRF